MDYARITKVTEANIFYPGENRDVEMRPTNYALCAAECIYYWEFTYILGNPPLLLRFRLRIHGPGKDFDHGLSSYREPSTLNS
jgi:hypothetical protein